MLKHAKRPRGRQFDEHWRPYEVPQTNRPLWRYGARQGSMSKCAWKIGSKRRGHLESEILRRKTCLPQILWRVQQDERCWRVYKVWISWQVTINRLKNEKELARRAAGAARLDDPSAFRLHHLDCCWLSYTSLSNYYESSLAVHQPDPLSGR